jgi:hypothetical protein
MRPPPLPANEELVLVKAEGPRGIVALEFTGTPDALSRPSAPQQTPAPWFPRRPPAVPADRAS